MTQNAINNSASIFDVDNINLDGNTVSTTDTNGNLVLLPDGTGLVTIGSGASANYLNRLRSSAGQWAAYNDGTDIFGDYNSAGSPESSVAANIASLCRDTTNGDLYIKTTDTVNTGWNLIGGNTGGRLVQQVSSNTSSVVTITSSIPVDNTIPQQTEGTEVLTVAITPTNASNILEIEFTGFSSNVSTAGSICTAIFQDATADAIAALRYSIQESANFVIREQIVAGTTSSTTFKARIGRDGSTNTFVNAGATGSAVFNGTAATILTVKEFQV